MPTTTRTIHSLIRPLALATTLLLVGTGVLADPATGGGSILDNVLGEGGITPINYCPAPSGDPCDPSGPASIGTGSGANLGAGNPIHLASGHKYRRETDLPALPGVLGLEIVRHYNSTLANPDRPMGILGRGWRLSYETELAVFERAIHILQADGSRVFFSRSGQDTLIAHDPAYGQLRVRGPVTRPEAFQWRWPDGRRLDFDARGRLLQIVAPDGHFVTLMRGPQGELLRVTDPQGRRLTFEYAPRNAPGFRGVVAIGSPVGRFTLVHQNDRAVPGLSNLVALTDPAGGVRRYHYGADEEEFAPHLPHHLTGISAETETGPVRIATYGYDARGRATLSVRGEPLRTDEAGQPVPGTGIEQVTVDYAEPGVTVITNSLGERTTYRHAVINSGFRLLEAIGPGCASCGPTNRRYAYDTLGRMVEEIVLGADGTPMSATLFEYDALGRVTARAQLHYLDGAPGGARTIERYAYTGDSPRPALVARPSVVPGKEHQVRIDYNDHGQPVHVTESGFSPLDETGAPATTPEAATAIERTTTYAYTRINVRSLLTEIDGPLPNGPANDPSDSDITRFEWDGGGDHVAAVIRPLGHRTHLAHDHAGRLASLTRDDGVRRITDRLEYAPITVGRHELRRIQRDAWLLDNDSALEASRLEATLFERDYDALGQRKSEHNARGHTARFEYDAAGRLIGVADDHDHRGLVELDSEGRVQQSALYRPGETEPARAAYYWYAPDGTPSARLRPDGRLDSWYRDPAGGALAHIDGNERYHVQVRNAQLDAHLLEAPDGSFEARVSDNEWTLVDDFGRVVRQYLPDHGPRHAQYDPAGRLLAMVHADGSAVRYRRDAAGRVIERTHTGNGSETPQHMTVTYAGALPLRIVDAEQTVHLTHDALGRRTAERVELAALSRGFSLATRYEHGTDVPTAYRLADGRQLTIERGPTADTPIARIALQTAWMTRLRDSLARYVSPAVADTVAGWMSTRTLVSDVHADAFDGLTAYTLGNGLQTRRGFDRAGRLNALHIDGVGDLRYGHEVGPRILRIDASTDNLSMPPLRFAALGGLAQPAVSRPVAELRKDALGRVIDDGNFHYTYTAAGQIETVTDTHSQRLVARYAYNNQGQRVSKTVFGEDGAHTTLHTLWQGNRRVAEIDADGRILTQYFYLSEGGRDIPVAKLEAATNPDNPAGKERLLFIHTDHRGAPVAMTDEHQRIVWQARPDPWGNLQPVGNATLALRLPGQYHDFETGLHDNRYRSYGPRTGRYLQPDPLGYPDGPDPYLYAAGDPINLTDPLGLYGVDVHYYLSYFLAVVAGLDHERAWVIAIGSQVVDENLYTDPFTRADPRALYHFTQHGFDRDPDPGEYERNRITFDGEGGISSSEWYAPEYVSRRLDDWTLNTQIARLRGYANAASGCLRYQFFGEYLHALQDTFSHRDRNNTPYAYGGHARDWTWPDSTYNQPVAGFTVNEERTLRMQKVVFDQLQAVDGTTPHRSFEDIRVFLEEWNKEERDDEKIELLLKELIDYGLTAPEAHRRFSKETALACRLVILREAGLNDTDGQVPEGVAERYPGAILPTAGMTITRRPLPAGAHPCPLYD